MAATTPKNDKFLNLSIAGFKDKLSTNRFVGTDYLSEPFRYEVFAHTSLKNTFDNLIGCAACLTLTADNQAIHYFHGLINQVTVHKTNLQGLSEYKITLVSWLEQLKKTHTNRIFIQKTPREILQTVFSSYKNAHYDLSFLAGGDQTLDYFVQYQESDFNFISRLLEKEGFFYYFIHNEEGYQLIIADQNSAYNVTDVQLSYNKSTAHTSEIKNWEHNYQLTNNKIQQSDYNFLNPHNLMLHQAGANRGSLTLQPSYIYPGDYQDDKTGAHLTMLRANQAELSSHLISATTHEAALSAGSKFKVIKHESVHEQGSYVALSVHHQAQDASSAFSEEKLSSPNEKPKYFNQITCMVANRLFYPALNTTKPIIAGSQTGTVTGPEGEEIYTDEYGRVQVAFNWLQNNGQTTAKSYWVRVSQHWAGKSWGLQFIPRIGDEVIISFENGDPSRPMILGSAYNAHNLPPYPLPDSSSKSGIKTRSTLNGDASQYNEFSFEDLTDAEKIRIHAQKDFKTDVNFNQHIVVKNNHQTLVKEGNQYTTIAKGKAELVASKLISLKTGDSVLSITAQGISLSAAKIQVNQN